MRVALSLAARVAGQTMPNPAVGCVLVKDDVMMAAAHTARGGRPHAETQALQQAGDAARGATAYVTLEPCAHVGKTGACAQALIDAGVARVVVACVDPYAHVNGAGIAMIRAAGIEVTLGVCEAQALHAHRGFFKREREGLPWVSLKLATSLDGCVANAAGESQWITGSMARAHGHRLRAQHEAILTGIGTVQADDPLLTCRLAGLEDASPVRVVMDSRLVLDINSQLVQSAKDYPLWVVAGAEYSREKYQALVECGVTIHVCDTPQPSCKAALRWLATQGVSSVLVEAGTTLSTAMVDAELVDYIYWYRAPLVMGVTAKPALVLDGTRALAQMPRWTCLRSTTQYGADVLEEYAPQEEQ